MLYEFTVKVPTEHLDLTIEKLNIEGLYNLYYEPAIEILKVKNGYAYEEKQQETMELRIYAEENDAPNLPEDYLKKIAEVLDIAKDDIQSNRVDDSDWTLSFEDIDLGNDWVLCYSGLNENYPDKHVLKFEPQAAFGTGLHETTQDCLRILLNHELAGQSVLDLGTGSGVLSIAAALKNAKEVVAVDYEPVEREIIHNIHLNNIETPFDIIQADLIFGDHKIQKSYDWIIINIGADETIKILERHDLLNKSNNFLISGVVEWNAEKLMEAFENNGFYVEAQRQSKEWMTIYFSKK